MLYSHAVFHRNEEKKKKKKGDSIKHVWLTKRPFIYSRQSVIFE